ncbi:MAG: hypothetical protein WBL27_05990 [Salinimicrobium sp.]
MKKISSYLCFIAVFAILFASCSKDEESIKDQSEKASLSFGAIVQDLVQKASTRQSTTDDLPECSEDVPAYVEIVLLQDGSPVVGSAESPFRIDLVDGQIFTEEVPELELTPGTYTLDEFMVYDEAGDLIWVAPRGGILADFVETPLPLTINLGAGVKKYVDVSVLCYDNRDVRQYGYLFFDIDTNEAIEMCVFGNYCDDTGRHYPAHFRLDVYDYTGGQMGDLIHDDLMNTVTMNEFGDYAGTPVCFPLPDREGQDQYFIEVTLLNSDAYGNVTEEVVKTAIVTDDEVKALFDGDDNLDYAHFRVGCSTDDDPIFQDPDDDAMFYKTCLYPTNDSGAVGFAYFRLDGNQLEATVMALGLEPGQEHLQHIHGFANDSNSTCPPADAAGEDGLIDLDEGAPYYGPVILPLTDENGDMPVAAANGWVIYTNTFMLGSGGLPSVSDLGPLENRAVVLHGMTADGDGDGDEEYVPTLPVSCGTVTELQ